MAAPQPPPWPARAGSLQQHPVQLQSQAPKHQLLLPLQEQQQQQQHEQEVAPFSPASQGQRSYTKANAYPRQPAAPHQQQSGIQTIDLPVGPSIPNGPRGISPGSGTSSGPFHRRHGSRNAPQMSEFEFLDGSQFHVESSSSDSDFQPTRRPARPHHGRSMSHPFPSLFSSKKKKRQDLDETGFFANASGDEDIGTSAQRPKGHPAQPTTYKHGQPGPGVAAGGISGPGSGAAGVGKDFTTGNCMTCGSIVRWPMGLNVFKCTICLTVNDVKPLDHYPGNSGDGNLNPEREDLISSSTAPHPTPNHGPPISTEHTKLLVRQCLRSVILRHLSIYSESEGRDHVMGPSSLITHTVQVLSQAAAGPKAEPSSSEAFTPQSYPFVEQGDTDEPTLSPSCIPRSTIVTPRAQLNPLPRFNKLSPRSYSTSSSEQRPHIRGLLGQPCGSGSYRNGSQAADRPVDDESKMIFTPLENYIISCFSSWKCLRSSFGGSRLPSVGSRHAENVGRRAPEPRRGSPMQVEALIPELDPKLLLLGDFAENGTWWTGSQGKETAKATNAKVFGANRSDEVHPPMAPVIAIASKSPSIDWGDLEEWYTIVVNAGQPWKAVYQGIISGGRFGSLAEAELQRLEAQVLVAQDHARRALLKATEMMLKRPGRPLAHPHDIRFLLLIIANPLLAARSRNPPSAQLPRSFGPVSGQHSGIIKRIVGLLSNASNDCHSQLVTWLSRYPFYRFVEMKDLVSGFLVYRLLRQNDKKPDITVGDMTGGLVPNMSSSESVASLHAALGNPPSSGGPLGSGVSKKPKDRSRKTVFRDDWQIKAAARVLALIFAANDIRSSRRSSLDHVTAGPASSDSASLAGRVDSCGSRILPSSDFYVSLLDDSDILGDFEAWESKRRKFSFCQYPFLLSIGAKIQILEHDAKRQMQKKARDAFFDSIMSRRAFDQHLLLNVRRDCLVEDSLKAVSEAIGSGGEDIKKRLRVTFKGEEGVDAGGLRKEWFLLLVREVFNPDHGMFVYDDDSRYCYFNSNSFETSDQYFLVGVVVGLAIYNSTILDVAFPPFVFRKLLAAAPSSPGGSPAHRRPPMITSLDDLAEFRPRLARGLRQLLEYDGDVESTFCLDFVIDAEKYGSTERVPLVQGGENRPVTNSNRKEYVDLYVKYLLDTAVSRQFEPFKRGFFTVCGGNALSLFRPEEIELLVRGSGEPLDVSSLRAVATYDGWSGRHSEEEGTVRWFWESFQGASPQDQRKLLTFITGSDRIPAMGATSLVIRLVCLGDDCGRYPTARTCFNTLALWRYGSKEKLEMMLWNAVHESEGFGLK